MRIRGYKSTKFELAGVVIVVVVVAVFAVGAVAFDKLLALTNTFIVFAQLGVV